MLSERLAGILIIIVGVALWIATTFASPPNIYDTNDLHARMAILDAHPTRWIASQVLLALGALVPTAGLGLLVLSLRGEQGGAGFRLWARRGLR